MQSVEVSIVIPAFNQHGKLPSCVAKTAQALRRSKIRSFEIILCEDGSTDGTYEEAAALSRKFKFVRLCHEKSRTGKGGAICRGFSASHGKLIAFLDADLATSPANLDDLLFAAKKSGIAVGSRYLKSSRSQRSISRIFASTSYNWLVRFLLGSKLSDHQCGFKAFRRDVALMLCRETIDRSWFWDTEALVVAQRRGINVVEVPVSWREQGDTTIRLWRDVTYLAASVFGLWLRLLRS